MTEMTGKNLRSSYIEPRVRQPKNKQMAKKSDICVKKEFQNLTLLVTI